MTKIKKTPKQKDDRKFVFIKDKELDDKTIFKVIELVLNSKIKGNMIFVVIGLLIFLSLVLFLIHYIINY